MDRVFKTGCVEGVVDLCVVRIYVVFDILGFKQTTTKMNKQEWSQHQTLGNINNELDEFGPGG